MNGLKKAVSASKKPYRSISSVKQRKCYNCTFSKCSERHFRFTSIFQTSHRPNWYCESRYHWI